MEMYANGRMCQVPSDKDGKVDAVEVRRAANIPDGRALIMQKPNGENVVVPKRGLINADNYAHFMEAPTGRRGMKEQWGGLSI